MVRKRRALGPGRREDDPGRAGRGGALSGSAEHPFDHRVSSEAKSPRETGVGRPTGASRARSLVERAWRAVRRRTFAFDARPLEGIVAVGDGGSDLHSVSRDPRLRLVPRGASHPQGWVRIRLELASTSVDMFAPRVHVDDGAGFGETSFPLPEPVGGRIDAIGHLPRGTRDIRLRLAGRAGPLHIGRVTMQELSQGEALLRLLARGIGSRRQLPAAVARLLAGPGTLWDRAQGLRAAAVLRGGPSDYGRWVATHDRLDDGDRAAIRERVASFSRRPSISVVLSVHDVEERWLRRAIDSVRAQIYPDWELCVADGGSQDPKARRALAEYAAVDRRIRVVSLEGRGPGAAASNAAIAAARGELVAFLDQGDELPEHALYMIAEEVLAHPDAALLYSDEDRIDAEGRRCDPYFKPEPCPDLLLSDDLLAHLTVYRRDLVERIGGFRAGLDGSRDHDLALRAVETLELARIRHIPHVLYHARVLAGPTAAAAAAARPVRIEAARAAIRSHLERRGVAAEVLPAWEGSDRHRLRYALPAAPPRATVIVPTHDRVDLLRPCIRSVLERTDYPSYEVLVMDNGSVGRATLDFLRQAARHPRVRVVRWDRPFHFQAINNEAARRSSGELIVLLNDDTEVVAAEWLRELASHAVRPGIGAVGALLRYPDGSIQHAGVVLGLSGGVDHVHRHLPRGASGHRSWAGLVRSVSAVTGACLAVRRAVWDEVGGLDESYSVAGGDIDFCLRVRARGYRNLFTPYAELVHRESSSRGSDAAPENRERAQRESTLFRERWAEALRADPCYSPNLTLGSCDGSPAFPPRSPRPWCGAPDPRAARASGRGPASGELDGLERGAGA